MPAACILNVVCSSGPSPSKGYGGAGRDSEEDSKDDQRPGTASALEELGQREGRCLREAAIRGSDRAWGRERAPRCPCQHGDEAGRLGLREVLRVVRLSGGFRCHRAGVLEGYLGQ